MKSPGRALLLVVLLSALAAAGLTAQGVTTASIFGVVAAADSAGISEAIVTVTNTANGARWQTVSRGRGRYSFEYLSVGGPYTVQVKAIGFKPASRTGINLSLGDRRQVDFSLAAATVELPELVVTAPLNPRLNTGRTGPDETISAAVASNIPVVRRDFGALTLLSPQGVLTRDSGVSFAGQSDRLNSYQIDGTNNSDMGGIHGPQGFGAPGSTNRVRTLSVEAIKELQILIAPFDVRYGNFAGGLVNAVTRSGSNKWEGSISGYFQDQSLTGKDQIGNRAAEFSTGEATLTLGGPIVRNRAAFFLDAGLQRFGGARSISIGTDTTNGRDSLGIGVRLETMERFQDILRNTYHVDPGVFVSEPYRNPGGNVFAKVTLWPALNQLVEISHNHAQGTSQSPPNDPLVLSSAGREEPSTVNNTRLSWIAVGGRGFSNELTVARQAVRESCIPAAPFPMVIVTTGVDPDSRDLVAGATGGCPDRFADQTVWELTDNATWSSGFHHFTIGTHDEFLHLNGSRRPRIPAGQWRVNSLDSLEAGIANGYVREFSNPNRPAGPESEYQVQQFGLYAQDRWTPVPRLTLTAGLRFDVAFLPRTPNFNPGLFTDLGANTAVTPSGNGLWSPRLGFNYDLGGHGTAFLRGGVGIFSGRPVYLYFSNIFETTGLNWLRITCGGAATPAITLDPDNQPTSCVGQGPGPVPTEINYFNPSFRYPRNLRLALGTDVALPWNMVGTIDLLYIKGIDQFDITDINLAPPIATSAGEGGRLLYGTIDPANGEAHANRVNPNYGIVAEIRNSSGDRAYSATAQLHKQFRGTELSVAYTYTDAKDRMSADCFNVTFNLHCTPLDGTLNDRSLSTSRFEARHKVTIGGTMTLPLGFRAGVFYNGYSGQPYTYLVLGDANADGQLNPFDGNDPVYVPKDAADISLTYPANWAKLDRFIRADPCLKAQRGKIMRRNSCQSYWMTLVNTRLSRPMALGHGQVLELMVDIFNLPNMLFNGWGVHRVGNFTGDFYLLELKGYDQAKQRGKYIFTDPGRTLRDDEATRWRMQLGARYTF